MTETTKPPAQRTRDRRRARTGLLAALAIGTATVLAPLPATAPAEASLVPHAEAPLAAPQRTCADGVIDDFTAGAYRSADLVRDTEVAVRRGPVLGGRRLTRIQSGRQNPYRFPSTLVVPADGKAPLVVSSGYQAVSKLQVLYGVRRPGELAPLDADLSCHDRFRVHLAGSDLGLNVVVQVKSASSDVVYQCATNTEHVQPTGLVVELEFKCFVTNDPEHPPVDWTDIDRVLLQVQPTIQVGDVHFGSVDYAISRFDLEDAS